MTDSYTLHEAPPELHEPVLVVAMDGWIDASGAAAAAMIAVRDTCDTRVVATFDSDMFVDYRARRPTMELRDGVSTRLVWPVIELRAGRDAAGHDLLTLSGPEPDSQWQRFADDVTTLARQLGVRMMVGLGAYPFATPHTRSPRLSCTTPSPELAAEVPFLKNSVDVPAGMAGVLEHAFTGRGIPALGVWAQVPHYIASMNYPAASAALLDGLREVSGIEIDSSELAHAATVQRLRLDQLVAANPEHQAMLRQLEELYDTSAEQTLGLGSPTLPSGDELVAELERFLRDQGD